MNDLVTVCICTYNREQSLKHCIESVIGQSYKNIEIIIIDDNSSDGTQKLAEEFIANEHNIKYHRNETNMGLAYNRNLGIEKAEGKYFSFVDDDDHWHPDFIKSFVDTAENKDEDTIFCGGYRENYKDAVIEYYYDIELSLIEAIKKGYTPPVASQFYFAKTLKKISGYNTKIKSGVDHDLWIRLTKENVNAVMLNGGYACVNSDIGDDSRMTINYENRQKKLMSSIVIWEEDLKAIDKGFAEHFKKSYSYYLKSKFAIINLKKRNFKAALKLFMECPFKFFFIRQMLMLIIRKLSKLFRYNILKQRYIRFRVGNTFPPYRK